MLSLSIFGKTFHGKFVFSSVISTQAIFVQDIQTFRKFIFFEEGYTHYTDIT